MEGNWNGAQGNNKYQYNEKEWNDDFGLGWNDYGARFYDAVVGRFFTKDRFAEKYTTQTPYQYAGNNPIKNIDINGDSILIRYGTGFLGLGKKEILVYKGGKLSNRDGSDYTGKVKGFLKSAVTALDKINSGSKGSALLDKFEGKLNLLIKSGNKNEANPNDNTSKKLARSFKTITTIVNFSSGSSTGGPDVNGNTDRPSFIGLAHEIGHSKSMFFGGDIIDGSARYQSFDPKNQDKDLQKVTNDEYNAVHIENEIRIEHGVPLREYYSKDSEGKGFMPFLQPGTNRNIITGKPY